MSWMTDSKWSVRRMRQRYEDVCCLIHSMDGEIVLVVFLYRGKMNKIKNEIKLHVSWWQWRLKDVEESHSTDQLTEREWRRPLTWLDRFRDAVLLPASWGDENIQAHVGNRRWNIVTSIDFRSFYARSRANVYFTLVKAVLVRVGGKKQTFDLNI